MPYNRKGELGSIATTLSDLLAAAWVAVHNFASIDRNGEQRQR
jgi:hypothetical protein